MRSKKLIGYCFTKNLKEMREADIRALDGVNVAFGTIKNGKVHWNERRGKKDIARIRAINPAIKIVLSVGGWEADGFSQAAETEENRKKFAQSAAEITKEYGFDGIDIDWEYPCSDKAGIRAIPEDKENFTLLLREIRNELNKFSEYKILSIAAGALKSYVDNTQMKEVAGILDYVQLMTYDLYGEWDEVTGHHAGLYSSVEGGASSDNAIRLFAAAGVPYEKLVMGAAFYSREWKDVKEAKPGSHAGKAGKTHSYDKILKYLETGEKKYIKMWDDKAKAAYLYNGSDFVSYEDEHALQTKAEYVKEKNMYGIMYWEYGLDRTYRLTHFLREQLDK
ncbi:MAG: chitinase [Clostridiales bacterium]|nr:chitinase [Clostridiales bacterium]